jgi:NADPH:quinone reductase-like Zn-dependent oxidoreductase
MKAIFLIRTGDADKAFELRETKTPRPQDGQVMIKVEGFGLNFADIVAREGMYREAPPRPCILGYDVVGNVVECGNNVTKLKVNDRVVALTRFGGYAEYAVTDARAAVKIPETLNVASASSLATQFCTAYYCAAMLANIREGEKIIIHSAAGGVGNALLQFSNYKRCEVIATTSSASKIDLLKQHGAAYVINTSEEDFYEAVKRITKNDGVDVIFDAMGGSYVWKGIKLLAPGGRIVCYGASQMTGTNLFSRIKTALQFGFYHPAQFMMPSKSLMGVNMLHIADKRPRVIEHCLEEVVNLFQKKIFVPLEGKIFNATEIAAAHRYLQEKKATGKVALTWE